VAPGEASRPALTLERVWHPYGAAVGWIAHERHTRFPVADRNVEGQSPVVEPSLEEQARYCVRWARASRA
jgi:hypothetical protein